MKNRGARHGFHNCWQLSENAHEMTFQCSVWNRELQPAGYFPWIRDCGRNSNPPLHTWVRAAAVDKWWKHAKVKTVLSARKVMATVFWDSQGIVLVDCLEMGKIIIRPYAELSDCLLWSCWRWIEEKRSCFTRTTWHPTNWLSQWQACTNWVSNWFLIQFIPRN